MHYTTTLVYKNHFIGISVLIKISIHAFLRRCQYNMAITVHQYRHPALQIILYRFYFESFQAAVFQHFFFCHLWRYIYLRFCFDYLGWRMSMI